MKKTTTIVAGLLFAVGLLAPLSQVAAQERVVVETREGEVLRVVGRTVIIRNDQGVIRKYTELPKDVKLYVDGKPAKISDLKKGMKLNAVRWENVPAPVVVTYEEVQQMAAAAPAPAAQPAARPAPAPAPTPAQLPKTGSDLPLVGLAGLMLTLIGGGVLFSRRQV